MTPQAVEIHGTPCWLKTTGGDRLTYAVVRRDTGALITEQPSRLLAVARAAVMLHTPKPTRRKKHAADAGRT